MAVRCVIITAEYKQMLLKMLTQYYLIFEYRFWPSIFENFSNIAKCNDFQVAFVLKICVPEFGKCLANTGGDPNYSDPIDPKIFLEL